MNHATQGLLCLIFLSPCLATAAVLDCVIETQVVPPNRITISGYNKIGEKFTVDTSDNWITTDTTYRHLENAYGFFAEISRVDRSFKRTIVGAQSDNGGFYALLQETGHCEQSKVKQKF